LVTARAKKWGGAGRAEMGHYSQHRGRRQITFKWNTLGRRDVSYALEKCGGAAIYLRTQMQ
jgi:hypothetical protein